MNPKRTIKAQISSTFHLEEEKIFNFYNRIIKREAKKHKQTPEAFQNTWSESWYHRFHLQKLQITFNGFFHRHFEDRIHLTNQNPQKSSFPPDFRAESPNKTQRPSKSSVSWRFGTKSPEEKAKNEPKHYQKNKNFNAIAFSAEITEKPRGESENPSSIGSSGLPPFFRGFRNADLSKRTEMKVSLESRIEDNEFKETESGRNSRKRKKERTVGKTKRKENLTAHGPLQSKALINPTVFFFYYWRCWHRI